MKLTARSKASRYPYKRKTYFTAVTGCSSKNATNPEKSIKVGVTAGPHAEIIEIVKKVAAKEGLKIEIVEFNDYMQPNIALNQGNIDVNSRQDDPAFQRLIKAYKSEKVKQYVLDHFQGSAKPTS
jgi:D-methionine transport system substrate-binding protein